MEAITYRKAKEFSYALKQSNPQYIMHHHGTAQEKGLGLDLFHRELSFTEPGLLHRIGVQSVREPQETEDERLESILRQCRALKTPVLPGRIFMARDSTPTIHFMLHDIDAREYSDVMSQLHLMGVLPGDFRGVKGGGLYHIGRQSERRHEVITSTAARMMAHRNVIGTFKPGAWSDSWAQAIRANITSVYQCGPRR